MKVSKETASKNRTDVVRAASRSIRRDGVAAASIADIAASAGLTHGAVYRHFPSKTALVTAATTNAFDDIIGLLQQLGADGSGLAGYVRTYLSSDHRDHFPWGCPAAPLAAEMSRLEPEVQTAFTDGLRRNLSALAELKKDADLDEASAMVILSTLVGAMALARATKSTDPRLSDAFLDAARNRLAP